MTRALPNDVLSGLFLNKTNASCKCFTAASCALTVATNIVISSKCFPCNLRNVSVMIDTWPEVRPTNFCKCTMRNAKCLVHVPFKSFSNTRLYGGSKTGASCALIASCTTACSTFSDHLLLCSTAF